MYQEECNLSSQTVMWAYEGEKYMQKKELVTLSKFEWIRKGAMYEISDLAELNDVQTLFT